MQAELTLGWLHDRMPAVIEYHRQKMTYGSKVKSLGFLRGEVSFPLDRDDYWASYMMKVHPWNQLQGVFIVCETLPRDTKVLLSCEVVGRILSATKEFKG